MQIPLIPEPLIESGRLFFVRSALEKYKKDLLRAAGLAVPDDDDESEIIELVPAAQACRELGFGRRSLGRRLIAARREREAAAKSSG
jgi:hypothetical protein